MGGYALRIGMRTIDVLLLYVILAIGGVRMLVFFWRRAIFD